ncbi:hypothetical protein KKH82_06715 [Patescibacteria group bacterium]|nr:hypothetical protein [Patescibacteria group bacterium]
MIYVLQTYENTVLRNTRRNQKLHNYQQQIKVLLVMQKKMVTSAPNPDIYGKKM